MIASDSFSSLGAHIHWPRIKECLVFVDDDFSSSFRPSDRYLECLIRYVGLGSHHPGGTCKMGTNAKNSVVDSQFKYARISLTFKYCVVI